MVTIDHSPRTASSPCSRNCRNRIPALMMPKTGSTVCLRFHTPRARRGSSADAAAFHRIRQFTERRRVAEALHPRRAKQGHSLALASLPRQVMRLTSGGDQGVDIRLDTGGHVGLTEGDLAQFLGQGTERLHHCIGVICCLSLAAWVSPVASTSVAAWAFEAPTRCRHMRESGSVRLTWSSVRGPGVAVPGSPRGASYRRARLALRASSPCFRSRPAHGQSAGRRAPRSRLSPRQWLSSAPHAVPTPWGGSTLRATARHRPPRHGPATRPPLPCNCASIFSACLYDRALWREATDQRRDIHLIDDVRYKTRQVVLPQPVIQRWRQQVGCVTITGTEMAHVRPLIGTLTDSDPLAPEKFHAKSDRLLEWRDTTDRVLWATGGGAGAYPVAQSSAPSFGSGNGPPVRLGVSSQEPMPQCLGPWGMDGARLA